MADITKCMNENCPLKYNCYRYTAEASEYQSYADFKPQDGKCDHYWGLSLYNEDISEED